METLAANNPDAKAPMREPLDQPTADDPDLHNPPLKVTPITDDEGHVIDANRKQEIALRSVEWP